MCSWASKDDEAHVLASGFAFMLRYEECVLCEKMGCRGICSVGFGASWIVGLGKGGDLQGMFEARVKERKEKVG